MEDYNILLQIERNALGCAEVFHCIGDGDAQALAQCEKVVNGCASCKNYCSMVENRHLLLAKFFGRNALDLNKGAKNYLDIVFLCDIVVGRFLCCRLGL